MLFHFTAASQTHEINFCGESIPIENDAVAQKLMNVIKSQIPEVNLPQLRKRAEKLMPTIEYILKKTGLPMDLKYLPVIESGFINASSKAGAQGVWQLMQDAASDYGLVVSESRDDRNDFIKATIAACKLLASYYLKLKKDYNISSWVLTAAAYNFGLKNITNVIDKQGADYFSMRLNRETAVYVYKLIAVKELFEYPELYLKNFNYNIFNATSKNTTRSENNDTALFTAMKLNVNKSDNLHPSPLPQAISVSEVPSQDKLAQMPREEGNNFKLVSAQIVGKYKNFSGGTMMVTIELRDNLQVRNRYTSKGNTITGKGWIVNERVYVDLGYDSHDVILYDSKSRQGIPISSLKNKEPIILKVHTYGN